MHGATIKISNTNDWTFQVLMAVKKNIAILRVVTLCSLVDIYTRFGET